LFNHGLWSEWRPACAASPIVPSLVLSRFGQRAFTSLRKSSMAFASRQLMRHPPVGRCPPAHRLPRPRTPTGRSGPLRPPSWRAALHPRTVSRFLRIVGQAHSWRHRHLCIVFPVPSLVGLEHHHEMTRIFTLNQINVLDARPLRPLRTTRTRIALVALVALRPLRTTLTLRPLRTTLTLRPLRPLRTSLALLALVARRAIHAVNAIFTARTPRAALTLRAALAALTLRPWRTLLPRRT